MTDNLRTRLIRLAHQNPELRADLLPLLKQASYENRNKTASEVSVSPTRAKAIKDAANDLARNARDPRLALQDYRMVLRHCGTLARHDLGNSALLTILLKAEDLVSAQINNLPPDTETSERGGVDRDYVNDSDYSTY